MDEDLRSVQKKDTRITIRLTPKERDKLEYWAQEYGITISALLRMVIRDFLDSMG